MTAKSPWSVKGVPAETRATAKAAARRAGLTIGEWLSRTIEQASRGDGQPADVPAPALEELKAGLDKLALEVRRQGQIAAERAAERGRSVARQVADEAIHPLRAELHRLERDLDDIHAIARDARSLESAVHEVRRIEQDLARKLEAPADGQVEMAERIAALEAKADNARLLVAPLEAQVQRIAERLTALDGGDPQAGAAEDADWGPEARARRHARLFSRIFEE